MTNTPAAKQLPTVHEVAKLIDHALLSPDITRGKLIDGLLLAADYDVYTVCVRPADIEWAAEVLQEHGSGVKVGTVIGFPHGSSTVTTKVFETVDALRRGAKEIDFVLNIANLKSGMFDYTQHEMSEIVQAAQANGVEKTKVIFETAYLSDDEIKHAAQMAELAGVDFVKTSTGFASAGATLAHVRIMREAVSEQVQVKASGGVRDLDTLLTMRAAGVTRFGTSATAVILDDLRGRLATGVASGVTATAAY